MQDRIRHIVDGKRRRYLQEYRNAFDSHYEARESDSDSDCDYDNCPICLRRPLSIVTMDCGHQACGPCLDLYFVHLQGKRTCPSCRQDVTQCKTADGTVRGIPDPAPPRYVGRHPQKKLFITSPSPAVTLPNNVLKHSIKSPITGMCVCYHTCMHVHAFTHF